MTGLSASNKHIITAMAGVQKVLPAESASHDVDEWFDMDSPMDSTVEISADGGEQDLFSAYTQGYVYFLAPSLVISLRHPINRSATQRNSTNWSQWLMRVQ